jgi:aspartyl-tRNA(Asn)/glutamyl-tRNA(Gln) amidotransferase subunit A
MTDFDLAYGDIADLGERLWQGRLSPVSLAEHCIARILRFNPDLHAFITVTARLARQQARAAERELGAGERRGPLHGIPVAVKDFYDTAGIRTTAGFERFRERVPARDADLVVKLREAGAVLVGKTNMHELGMGTTSLDSAFGAVINPWSARHVAGGSSGGSAVALATGLCFATVDTDAIGSGRLPAAICGVTCFKPGFGVLSGEGILAGEPVEPAILALSHPCVSARLAADVRLVMQALSPTSGDNRARRVGIASNHVARGELAAAFAAATRPFAAMGLQTRPIEIPFQRASFDVRNIERDRARINEELFAEVDALALPTLAEELPTVAEARARGDNAVAPAHTFFCNYFGLPAITVPCGFDGQGLPVALQLVGPRGEDARVLALAEDYQRAIAWRFRPAPQRRGD